MMRYVDRPFRMTGELVTENGNPVDRSTRLEMTLQLFWGSAVIDLHVKSAKKGSRHNLVMAS